MRVLMICPELPTASNPGSMAPAARQIHSIERLGVDVEIVDMRGIPKLKYALAARRIRKLAGSVDLVHAHFGYCGWLALLQRQRPVVMSYMGDDLLGTPKADGSLEWLSRQIVRINQSMARRMSEVIVKSAEMADVLGAVHAHVIPNGVDVEAFCPMARAGSRQRLGIGDGYKVLFPGNPENPRKGWPLALEATQAAARALGQDVELLPLWGVSPEDVVHYMNACDAMLMTSFIEGSPNVVKEAMACNCPVIGVPVGDVGTMLSGVQGCHYCERDAEQLGRALVTSFHSPECGGRQAILDRGLDLKSVAGRILDIYQLALRRQQVPAEVGSSGQSIAAEMRG